MNALRIFIDYFRRHEYSVKNAEISAADVFTSTFSCEDSYDDSKLTSRIADFFIHANDIHNNPQGSFWKMIVEEKKLDVAAALLNRDLDLAAKLLRDPVSTMFHYGFDNTVREFSEALDSGGDAQKLNQGRDFHLRLMLCAEAMGVNRLANPENGATRVGIVTDNLIDQIEYTIGTEIKFPNPFRNEFGIASKRGVISYRGVNSFYQVYLLKRYASETSFPSVLEIGGGLGRTAYFAHMLGFRNYTLIDLPTSAVAQANFLGRSLGEDQISLQGENKEAPVNIRIPEFLPNVPPVDIVLNVDSFTEMSRNDANAYIEWAKFNAEWLISINHEANPFTARELMISAGLSPSRERYWLRDGYIVEIAKIK